MNNSLGEKFENLVALVVSRDIATQFLNLAVNIVAANALGPKSFGVWIVLLLIPNLAEAIGRVKIEIAQVYYIQTKMIGRIDAIGNINFVSLIISGLLVAALLMSEEQIAKMLDFSSTDYSRVAFIFLVMSVPFNIFLYNGAYHFLALRDIDSYTKPLLLRAALMLVSILFGYFLGVIDVQYISVSFFLSYFISFLFMFVSKRKELFHIRFNFNVLKSLFSYAMPIYIAGGVNQVGDASIRILGLRFLEVASLSFFFNAHIISKLATKLIDPVMGLLLGELSAKNRADRISFTLKFLRVIILLSSSLSLIVFLFSDLIIIFIFNDTFLPSIPLLKYLSFSIVLLAWCNVIGNFFNANGTPVINLCISLISYSYLILRLYLYPLESDVTFLARAYVEFACLNAITHFLVFLIFTRVKLSLFLPTSRDVGQIVNSFLLVGKIITLRLKSILRNSC